MKSGRYEKQDFKRTLALCPRCKTYMTATRADSQVEGKRYSKALPMKYCIKCQLILVLDKSIEIEYQENSTHQQAWNQMQNQKQMKNRRSNKWLSSLKLLT